MISIMLKIKFKVITNALIMLKEGKLLRFGLGYVCLLADVGELV